MLDFFLSVIVAGIINFIRLFCLVEMPTYLDQLNNWYQTLYEKIRNETPDFFVDEEVRLVRDELFLVCDELKDLVSDINSLREADSFARKLYKLFQKRSHSQESLIVWGKLKDILALVRQICLQADEEGILSSELTEIIKLIWWLEDHVRVARWQQPVVNNRNMPREIDEKEDNSRYVKACSDILQEVKGSARKIDNALTPDEFNYCEDLASLLLNDEDKSLKEDKEVLSSLGELIDPVTLLPLRNIIRVEVLNPKAESKAIIHHYNASTIINYINSPRVVKDKQYRCREPQVAVPHAEVIKRKIAVNIDENATGCWKASTVTEAYLQKVKGKFSRLKKIVAFYKGIDRLLARFKSCAFGDKLKNGRLELRKAILVNNVKEPISARVIANSINDKLFNFNGLKLGQLKNMVEKENISGLVSNYQDETALNA